jgi:alkanesulfonate monooxygenase SsuD/methylene tetrahydromethanopterin reductase-like flavin-dependent oxidoreductase (luciferase family)
MLLAGVGPKTLDLAGTAFDGTILHPILTTDAVARSSVRVRSAADRAGRDPDRVEVHATVIVAPDRPPDEIVGARGLGYLLVEGLGDAIVAANGWDTAALAAIRAHPRFAGIAYHQLKSLPPAELAVVSRELPRHWVADAAAVGSAAECAARVDEYLDAGATHVLLHGLDSGATAALMAAYARRSGST